MHSEKANFLGDPHFPESLLDEFGQRRIRLVEFLFSHYCERGLTRNTDRPIAISGLEARLARTFEMRVRHGVFEGYLHRNLLWQRDEQPLQRLTLPDDRKVPSWSWKSWDGKIRFVHVTLGDGYWSNCVRFHSSETIDFAVLAPVRKFVHCKLQSGKQSSGKYAILDGDDAVDAADAIDGTDDNTRQGGEIREWVAFDGDRKYNMSSLSCVVLGKEEEEYDFSPPPDGPAWYVLVLGNAIRSDGVKQDGFYLRCGVACLRQRHISFGQEMKLGAIM